MLDKRRYAGLLDDARRLGEGRKALLAGYDGAASVHVSAPVGDLAGRDAIDGGLFGPLLAAAPDLERRVDILLAGDFKGARWFASTGYFVGRLTAPLWGVAPTGRPIWLRYGWYDRVDGDRIVESYVIFDVARFLIDLGLWPLAPQLGATHAPPPATRDGVAFDVVGAEESLKLVEAMIGGLMQFDGKSLASMGMRRFWTPDFHWYGPGGIGSARGHEDYERAHQRPFLAAFPDRVGGDHKCRIGDGAYVASTGWPSVRATHTGSGWLGLPATNKRVGMKVMDFWRRDGAMLAENWVFIDMIDLLAQIGVDVFARLKEWKAS
ncbi:MAG: ester cyclase [Parvularculaceae bacterium]|nr:ester cyclase [Parvularculaceae bacterium]